MKTRTFTAALLAGSAIVSPAMAQEITPPTTPIDPVAAGPSTQDAGLGDDIVVTGIRASQAKSIDLKREADAIVDAISAEDIGKLPDVTIADALQRISGVQIQRSAGEGATVNIRGLPQVVTLLNGEQYLSAGNLGSAQPNLTDVPASLMNAVVVFKSTDVRNAQSGISGTIDLRTRRPFDFKQGLTLAGNAEYSTGRDTRSDDYTASGLISWRRDNFGVLASVSKSNVVLGNNYAGISGGAFGNNDWGGSGANWIAPHGYDTFHREVERDRLGVSGAVQWEFVDGMTLTGEVFHAELNDYNRAAGMNISNRWTGLGWTNPTTSTDSGVISRANGNPWLDVDQYALDAWWVNSFSVNRTGRSKSTNWSLGLDYDRDEALTFSVRGVYADAELRSTNGQAQGDLSNFQYGADRTFGLFRDPNDRTRGPFYPADIAAKYPASQYSNGIVGDRGGRYINPNPQGYGEDPQLGIDISGRNIRWSGFDRPISGGLGAGKTLTDYMANQDSYAIGAYSSEGNQFNQSDLLAFRFDGAYDFEKADGPLFGLLKRVDAGFRGSRRRTEIQSYHLFSNFYAGNGASSPNGCAVQWKAIDVVMNQPPCVAGENVANPTFNPALPESATNPRTVFQGYTVNRPTKLYENNNTYFLKDFGSITEGFPGVWVIDPKDFDDPVAFQERVFGNAFPVIIPGNSYDVDFYEQSAYANAAIETGRLSGNVGLKVIRTEIRVRQNLTGPTTPYGDTNSDVGDSFASNEYWDYLPSVNLQYDITGQLRFRAAFSKTMIPLDLGNYGGGLAIFTSDSVGPTPTSPNNAPVGVRQVTGANRGGSPFLKPWRSNNYDVALEYYFGRASLANIGAFKLDINSFVQGGATTFESFPDGDGVIRREVPVSGPGQGEGGSLQGIEAGVKLAFSDFIDAGGLLRNFGIDANYTFSDSSQRAMRLDGERLPFQDNSKHQVNLALWYQDDRLQARAAYNFRTPRLSGVFVPPSTGCTGAATDPDYCVEPGDTFGIPIFQDTSQYVDVNVTYAFTDNFSLYANASNLFGEIERYYFQFDEDSEQFHSRNEFEPRYSVGIRAKF